MSLIGSIDLNKKITIYGAGISGLIIAYYLKKKGHQIQILEKSERVGGKIETLTTPYGLVEKAANAIYANTPILDLCHELGLSPIMATKKLKRLIYHQGQTKEQPISKSQLLRIFLNSWRRVPSQASSLYEFLLPLTGETIAYELVSTGLYGIYASDSKEIHPSVFFKGDMNKNYLSYFKSWLKEKKKSVKKLGKATSISFKGGMQDFVDALFQELSQDIKLNCNESLVDNSIICTDAFHASELTQISDLKKIEYKKVFSTTLFTTEKLEPLENAFGVLFSPSNRLNILGLVNNKEIFKRKNEKPYFSYTVIAKNESFKEELRKIYPNLKIENSITTCWERAIPIYNQKRIQLIEEIQRQLPARVALFSNYTGSLSLREIILSASSI